MTRRKKDTADKMALYNADPPPPPPPPPDHNSTSIIASLMRSELNMYVKQQAWGKVEDLLDTDPDVARAVDPATGELPLHVLARCSHALPLLVDITILKNPRALMQKDRQGALPLHAATASGSSEVLKIIFEAYKDGRKEYDGLGRLPIHVAAESNLEHAIRFLLDVDPASAVSVVQKPHEILCDALFLGGLPIHCACRAGASIEVIDTLLSSSSKSGKTEDYQGNLPLHLLLRYGISSDLASVKRLQSEYPPSLKRKDSNGDTPLIVALKFTATLDVIGFLLQEYPDAAREESGDKRLPLTIALENCFEDAVAIKLIEHAPSSVTIIDAETGLLPIEIAVKQKRSEELIHELLMKDLPIDLNDSSTTSKDYIAHQHSWEHVISADDYFSVVSNILQACTHSQRIALANTPCRSGEAVILETAAPLCKRELVVGTRLFGVIELLDNDNAPAFATDKTQIYYGVKYPDLPSQGVRVVYEGSSSASTDLEKGTPVLVKLTSSRELMEREISVRRDYKLSEDHVPPVYSVHHAEEQPGAAASDQTPLAYCISMECAQNTLENVWFDMKSKSKDARIPIEDIRSMAGALHHLHQSGLVHGDFGSHNVGKFGDGKWKLLGVGGAAPIGKATDPERGWYFPPEAIATSKKKKKKKKLSIKSKPSVVSITAATTIDTWAFGTLFYELLCGVPLPLYIRGERNANAVDVKAFTLKALDKKLAGLRTENEAAADLLARLLHPRASNRISSMDAVLSHEIFTRTEDDDISVPIPPPPPLVESTPEVADSEDSPIQTLKNPNDVIYPAKKRGAMPNDATNQISYPVLERRVASKETLYPIQERRAHAHPTQERKAYPIQERMVYPTQERRVTLKDSRSATEQQQFVSPQSYPRVEADCFSTASTKFRDNTTAEVERSSHMVPMQVVATEKKPRRRSSASSSSSGSIHEKANPGDQSGQESDTSMQKKRKEHAEAKLPAEQGDLVISACNSNDSDDSSEPGRIIPGSRRKKAVATESLDLQLV